MQSLRSVTTILRSQILVVAAHPDDEVLGCGGTMARLSQEGHDVHVAILGEGITSRFDERRESASAALETLNKQSRLAAETLGARMPHFFGLPDNRFDTVPLLDVVKLIEAAIARLEPQIVYSHHAGDLNIDHCVVHRAVLTATRPLPGCPVREVYAFEVPSSTDWAFATAGSGFQPNVFVDITETLDRKVAAMGLYAGESRAFPHPRSPELLRAQAARWGSVAGLAAAEAFALVRSIR